jgi:hypothetical protein
MLSSTNTHGYRSTAVDNWQDTIEAIIQTQTESESDTFWFMARVDGRGADHRQMYIRVLMCVKQVNRLF